MRLLFSINFCRSAWNWLWFWQSAAELSITDSIDNCSKRSFVSACLSGSPPRLLLDIFGWQNTRQLMLIGSRVLYGIAQWITAKYQLSLISKNTVKYTFSETAESGHVINILAYYSEKTRTLMWYADKKPNIPSDWTLARWFFAVSCPEMRDCGTACKVMIQDVINYTKGSLRY